MDLQTSGVGFSRAESPTTPSCFLDSRRVVLLAFGY